MTPHDIETAAPTDFDLPTAQRGGRLVPVAHQPWVGRDIAVDRSSARVAIAMSLVAWDGRVLPHFTSPDPGPVTGITSFEAGLLFCGAGSSAHQWDLDRFEHAGTLPIPRGGGRRSLAIHRGTLAAGSMARGGVVALVDTARARVEWTILGARAAEFSGRHLVATGEGGTTVFEWYPPPQRLRPA